MKKLLALTALTLAFNAASISAHEDHAQPHDNALDYNYVISKGYDENVEPILGEPYAGAPLPYEWGTCTAKENKPAAIDRHLQISAEDMYRLYYVPHLPDNLKNKSVEKIDNWLGNGSPQAAQAQNKIDNDVRQKLYPIYEKFQNEAQEIWHSMGRKYTQEQILAMDPAFKQDLNQKLQEMADRMEEETTITVRIIYDNKTYGRNMTYEGGGLSCTARPPEPPPIERSL